MLALELSAGLLAGKIDMFPGRTTHLTLSPPATGTFRGACAEYCGTAHALMAFAWSCWSPTTFELGSRAGGAAGPAATPHGCAWRAAVRQNGCGACHTVRGTERTAASARI